MNRVISRPRSRRLLAHAALITTLAGADAVARAADAVADQPTKTSINDSRTVDFPAGTLCDFHYSVTVTVTGTQTIFSDRLQLHLALSARHLNVDTGYTVTERDQLNQTIYPDGNTKEVGLHWHLRDPTGKLVVVGAGQMIFFGDPFAGNIVTVTPHVMPDTAGVICSALGGHPA